MSSENLALAALCAAMAAPALVVLITGGSLGAALLAAVLCLPISGPIMAAVFGAATELFGPKH
ncbi:MAG: hypothetical protein AB1412_10735 [Pseudomonadota bacterium]